MNQEHVEQESKMTLTDLDISSFNYPELNELKSKIETRMQDMRETGVPTLRERFIEEAAALGVTLEEVVASGKTRRGRPCKSNDGEQAVDAAL
jgi:TATA-binding protein-associated factor Taf7